MPSGMSMCDRNMNGGADNPGYKCRTKFRRCKTHQIEFIPQLNVMICAVIEIPIVAKDTLEIFQYFTEHNANMWLSMNTNAGAKDIYWWAKLAEVIGRRGAVIFSVDGLRDTNHLYRQNVVWDNVERNMQAFIDDGGRARWDFLIFQHNEHQVEEAEALANQWGCEKFIKKKSGRFITSDIQPKYEHQAVNRKGAETQKLAPPKEEKNKNLALLKQKEIEKSYGSMKEYLDKCNMSTPYSATH